MSQKKILINPKNMIPFFLGLLIPLPLFIDISTGLFVFIDYEINKPISTSAGQPVPLALFIFPIIILLKIKFREILNYVLIMLILFLLNLNLFDKLEFVRYLSLIIIPIFFYISYDFSKKDYNSFSKGYLNGFLIFLILHFFSFFINSLDSLSLIDNFKFGGRNFFGFEIYQFYVSFSAVISFLVSTLIFLYILKVKNKQFLIPLIFLCFFEIFLTLRKAAMLDIFLTVILVFFFIILSNKKSILTFRNLFFISVFSYIFYLIYTTVDSIRGVSVVESVAQRDGAYLIFFQILENLSINQILFGFEQGWGGYSNLFIEIFLRSGLFGFLPFFLSVFYFLRKFLSQCTIKIQYDIKYKTLINFYLLFIILSFLISNVVNMNFILPYYTINVICIILLFGSKLKSSI